MFRYTARGYYTIMRQTGLVEKGWGNELIWVTNDKYCSKFLIFKKGCKFSMHFHAVKEEAWYIMSGKFELIWIDTKTAKTHYVILKKDDIWTNKPLMPHQIICLKSGTILEASMPDSVEDNYRIIPGDSQR